MASTKQTRADWFAIGYALLDGQNEAMREANTNEPEGWKYSVAMNAWLKRVGLDKVVHDRAVRSRLLELIKNIGAVEKWLKSLPTDKSVHLNHPNSILRNWKQSTKAPAPPRQQKPKSATLAAVEKPEPVHGSTTDPSVILPVLAADEVADIVQATWDPEKQDALLRRLRKSHQSEAMLKSSEPAPNPSDPNVVLATDSTKNFLQVACGRAFGNDLSAANRTSS